jgi:trimethylamine-N-oxide reductase cytochrome c-type subunit TorC
MPNIFSRAAVLLRKQVALGVVGFAGIAIGVIGWGGFNTAMEATNSLEFCISCHEMRSTVFEEYKKTIHYSNPAGVRAICSDCHVPKDWTHKIIRKVQASGELWGKLTGSIDTQEKFEAKRLELAKHEWARMKASDSRECRNCHSFAAMDFEHQRPKAQAQMRKAAQEGGTCIDCHKGIAHKLPDTSGGYRTLQKELEALAARDGGKAEKSFVLKTAPAWGDAEKAAAGGAGEGRVLPAAAVKVLERKGDLVRVRIDGWQQAGAERLFVALPGKRIVLAAVSNDLAETATVKSTKHDDDTDIDWKEASIDLWMPRTALVADQKALWNYGSEMFDAACGACHSPSPPSHYPANQWLGIVNDMKANTALEEEEVRFLQAYLQYHAQDVAGGH